MKQHQVFTGSVNLGNHCYNVGQLKKFTFYAYGSGCDLVISTSAVQPFQVITEEHGYNITALDCSEYNGDIVVAYGRRIKIFRPQINSLSSNFDYSWIKREEFDAEPHSDPVSIIRFNSTADQILLGSRLITLWRSSGRSLTSKQGSSEWTLLWQSPIGSRLTQVDFSPYSRNVLFASLSEKDTYVKVWYERRSLISTLKIKDEGENLDLTCSFLEHPLDVSSFEWRKGLFIDNKQRFANVLLTSCEDHICRLWSETHKLDTQALKFHELTKKSNVTGLQNGNELLQPELGKPKFFSAMKHFHLCATINPLLDIPILPFLPDQNLKTRDEYGASIFTVHFLNNKFYKSILQKQELAEKENKRQQSGRGESGDLHQKTTAQKANQLSNKSVEQILFTWQNNRDGLFAIHPTDGSLLIWHIEWLDSVWTDQLRQPQISFSSRIPMAFPISDARTLCSRPIFFANTSSEQNILHSASCISLKPDVEEMESFEKSVYCDFQLLSKHSDGSMNLWQFCFNDLVDFSLVTSVFHLRRCCGHCFHLRNIVSHPTLPLMLSNSFHKSSSNDGAETSELILWRVDPVGPLTFSGGLYELAKVRTSVFNFDHAAWFPVIFSSLFAYKNNSCISTALVAVKDNKLHIFQAIVDAEKLLHGIEVSDHADSINLISQQSSTHPGCLLHLVTVEDRTGSCHWGEILFFDIFSETPSSSSSTASAQKPSRFVYHVIVVERNHGQVSLHTWRVCFTQNYDRVASKPQNVDYGSDVSSDSETEEEFDEMYRLSGLLSPLDVQVVKLATQNLYEGPLKKIECISSTVCNAPGLFSTSWNNCTLTAQHAPYELCLLYNSAEADLLSLYTERSSMDDAPSCSWKKWNSNGFSFPGTPVAIKFANMNVLAYLYSEQNHYHLAIYENASSGGSMWKRKDDFLVHSAESVGDPYTLEFNLEWISSENGSYFLALSFKGAIKIFIPTVHDIGSVGNNKKHQQQQGSNWRQLVSLSIKNSAQMKFSDYLPSQLVVSWTYGGFLVVGTTTEMFVYNSFISEMNVDNLEATTSSRLNLFAVAESLSPSLPHYHPDVLIELLGNGHFNIVKDILINLAFAINQIEQQDQKRLKILDSSFNSGGGGSLEVGFVKSFKPLCLHKLVKESGELSGFTYDEKTDETVDSGNNEVDDIELLLGNDNDANHVDSADFDSDAELNELLGIEKRTKTKADATCIDLQKLKAGYFGKEHCTVISDYLVHHKLIGVGGLHQMELMALANTVSLMSTNNADENNDTSSVGLSSGERGYAVSGNGTSSLDNCGLRFVTALQHHFCLANSFPAAGKRSSSNQALRAYHFAWAFHSETAEEILSLVPSVKKGAPKWDELKPLGVGWWIRSKVILRRLAEQLGRAAFHVRQNPLDAALYYLALNKKSVMVGLFRQDKNTKFQQFFANDFTEERWSNAAQKNAFRLLGQQRFNEAAAFFLLAGELSSAIDVCVTKMKDVQLGILIARLQQNDDVAFHNLLHKFVLDDKAEYSDNCFLRSMSYWVLGDYSQAVSTLLDDDVSHSNITDRFNFYFYLCSHPLVLKLQATTTGGHNNADDTRLKRGKLERNLVFETAFKHLQCGRPLLALDALSRLPAPDSAADDPPAAAKEVVNSSLSRGDTVDVDWSRPVDLDEETLDMGWSDDDDDVEEAAAPAESVVDPSTDDKPSEGGSKETAVVVVQNDPFLRELKRISIWRILMEEVKSLALSRQSDEVFRHELYDWLRESATMLTTFFTADCGSSEDATKEQKCPVHDSSDDDDADSSDDEKSAGEMCGESSVPHQQQYPTQLYRSHSFNVDWRAKRKSAKQRRKWLRCHQAYIRMLLSYCNMYDCSSVTSVKMELILLLQESFLDDRSHPPHALQTQPSAIENIPLLMSMTRSKNFMSDPFLVLSQFTNDILRYILAIKQTPTPTSESVFVETAVLCSQSAILSSSIYQLLSDDRTKTADMATPMSKHFPSPAQWPGVSLLQTLQHPHVLTNESRSKLIILFCEAVASVFVSLLAHALHDNHVTLLFRLSNCNIDSRMWQAVFGSASKRNVAAATTNQQQHGGGYYEVDVVGDVGSSETSLNSNTHPPHNHPRIHFSPPKMSILDWIIDESNLPEGMSDSDDYDEEDQMADDSDDGSDYSFDSNGEYRMRGSKQDDSAAAANRNNEPTSYAWCLLRLAILQNAITNLKALIGLSGMDMNELNSNSSLLSAVLRLLDSWYAELAVSLENCKQESTSLLPNTQSGGVSNREATPKRPAVLRYQVMLDGNNTPFEGRGKHLLATKRLWVSLIKKESLRGLFIKYIFHFKPAETATTDDSEDQPPKQKDTHDTDEEGSDDSKGVEQPRLRKVKILHKDPDIVANFCINNVNTHCISVSSAKEVQEIDVTGMLSSDSWIWIDETTGSSAENYPTSNNGVVLDEDDFAVVSGPNAAIYAPPTPASQPMSWADMGVAQTGQGASILMKRPLSGIKRMDSHPTLPYYLIGCRDGGISMWEWGHQHQIGQYRPVGQYSKVSNLYFSQYGNKFASVDADGYVAVWQVGVYAKPCFQHICHNRVANDCCFVGSTSCVATCGMSSSHKNIAVWDTLMPKRSVLIKDFVVFENVGVSCIKYLKRSRCLIAGSKTGQIVVYDERCYHAPTQRIAAHDSAVKSIALDPYERFYVTGSASGDVKAWDAITHQSLYVSENEHPRSSLFRNFGSGTMQLHVTGDYLFSCGADGTLKMTDLTSIGLA